MAVDLQQPAARKRGARLWSSVLGVLAVAAILIGLNVLVGARLPNAQLDLTRQRLYTVAPGTRQILAGLKEPITLRLFFSPQLGASVPAYGAFADRVREMLREYASLSNGKIQLQFLNPEPFSDVEDRALAYGLQGVPLDQGGEQIYFGLVGTNLLDDERTVPFFQPERERFLEYDLSRLVYELSNPKRPTIGVMSSLPIDGDPRAMMMRQMGQGGAGGAPWASMVQLRQAYTVKTVPLDAQAIDPDIQVLMVAQAQNLSDATLYAIDQFVMRGGRLMALVDPSSDAQANLPGPNGQPPTDTASNLKKLFDAWGIVYDPAQVVGDLTGAWRVRSSAASDRVAAVDYVAWFNIRDGISHDDPATADLTQVTVATAGALSKKDGSDLEFTPLLSTDDKSALIPVEQVRADPDPAKILGAFRPDGKIRVIAARIRGTLKSAFAGPPDLPAGQTRPANFPAHIAQSAQPANMVVVADSDILADRFWVRVADFFGQSQATPFSDNGPFVANLVGTLAGGDALIGLRSRGSSLHPFDVVDAMQRDAEAKFRQTQQALQAHLDETQKKLTDLNAGRDGGAAAAPVLTADQRSAVEDLRRDMTQTRGKLRNVQLELRRDISGLESNLRLFNIVLVPVVLALVAIGLGFARRQRRARARANAGARA